jgi:hypothetical protein
LFCACIPPLLTWRHTYRDRAAVPIVTGFWAKLAVGALAEGLVVGGLTTGAVTAATSHPVTGGRWGLIAGGATAATIFAGGAAAYMVGAVLAGREPFR